MELALIETPFFHLFHVMFRSVVLIKNPAVIVDGIFEIKRTIGWINRNFKY